MCSEISDLQRPQKTDGDPISTPLYWRDWSWRLRRRRPSFFGVERGRNVLPSFFRQP
jgi:hypothetical protein